MVDSCDELIMEMVEEYGLTRMGENDDDKKEDDDDEGNVTAHPAPAPPTATPEEIVKEEVPMEMVPEQEAPEVHEVVLVDVEPELLQPRLFNMIMWDSEESLPLMMNGPHELDDLLTMTWMNGSLRMEVMIEIESSSLSLKLRIKDKSLSHLVNRAVIRSIHL
jgi:hypothetical protein